MSAEENQMEPVSDGQGTKPRRSEGQILEELEKRVRLAELRAREVEAEVRYLEATAKRRALRSNKKESKDTKRGKRRSKSAA